MSIHRIKEFLYKNQLESAIREVEEGEQGNSLSKQLFKLFKGNSRAKKMDKFNLFKAGDQLKRLSGDILRIGYSLFTDKAVHSSITTKNTLGKTRFLYGGTYAALLAGIGLLAFNLLKKPAPCPNYPGASDFNIAIDHFDKENAPLLSFLKKNKPEKEIAGKLGKHEVGVVIHPLHIENDREAREKLLNCPADMIIYGDIAYGDTMTSYLEYAVANEKYTDYELSFDDTDEIEERHTDIFALSRGKFMDNIDCVLNFQLAIIYKERNEIEQAKDYFKKVIDCSKDSTLLSIVHTMGARMNRELGNSEKEIEWLQDAVEADPGNMLARKNLSVLLYEKGEYIESVEHMDAILEKKPQQNDIRIKKASALKNIGNMEEAEKEVGKIKETPKYNRNPAEYDKVIDKNLYSNLNVANPLLTNKVTSDLLLNATLVDFNKGNTYEANKGLDKVVESLDTADLSVAELNVTYKMLEETNRMDDARKVQEVVLRKGIELNKIDHRKINQMVKPK